MIITIQNVVLFFFSSSWLMHFPFLLNVRQLDSLNINLPVILLFCIKGNPIVVEIWQQNRINACDNYNPFVDENLRDSRTEFSKMILTRER